MKTYSKIFLLLIFSLNMINSSAYSCSCESFDTVKSELSESSAVFLGICTKAELIYQGSDAFNQKSTPTRKFTFEVKKTWKGKNNKTIEVITSIDSGACGYDFLLGEQYLVYAYFSNGSLHTGLCTRTRGLRYGEGPSRPKFRDELDELSNLTKKNKG